jgi:glutathione S-transferase
MTDVAAAAEDVPTLHQFLSCPRSNSVRAVLRRKQVAYRGVEVPIVGRFSLWRLSGQNWPPVLVHRKRVVVHADAILRYLDAEFPASPIFPAGAHARSEALALSRWIDGSFYLPCVALKYLNPNNRHAALASLQGVNASRPIVGLIPLGQRVRLWRLGYRTSRLTEIRARFDEGCAALDARLGRQDHLVVGEGVTYPDVRLFTLFAAMKGCDEERAIGEHAHLASWRARLAREERWLLI